MEFGSPLCDEIHFACHHLITKILSSINLAMKEILGDIYKGLNMSELKISVDSRL